MDRGADYCWTKAAEFRQRAEETTDDSVRMFLCLMRDNWMIAAKDFESGARGNTPGKSQSRVARRSTTRGPLSVEV
jgi:hypothetical protein